MPCCDDPVPSGTWYGHCFGPGSLNQEPEQRRSQGIGVIWCRHSLWLAQTRLAKRPGRRSDSPGQLKNPNSEWWIEDA